MQRIQNGNRTRNSRIAGPARFARLSADESDTANLLHRCPVVTASGEKIGTVDHLMVDVQTQQVCYVVLARKKNGAVVAIPWKAIYFDAGLGRLVFYTLY